MSQLRKHLPIFVALLATPLLTFVLAPERVGSVPVEPAWWYSSDPVIAAAQRRTFALRDTDRALEAAWERLDSRDKAVGLVARGSGLELRVDRDVPAAAAARFSARAREELSKLTSAPVHPVVLRISVDPATRANYRRATMLPERVGAPCVAMVRLNSERLAEVEPYIDDQLLGTCGLYARFGAPGAGMNRWLERTDLRAAAGHTGSNFVPKKRQKVTRLSTNMAVEPTACLAGRSGACERFFDGELHLAIEPIVAGNVSRVEATQVPRLAVFGAGQAGSEFRSSLQGLRASLGDERFERIWRSESEPVEAFALNEGRPLAEWVRERLELSVEPYHAGPMIGGMQLGLALLLVAAFAGAVTKFAKRQFRS